MFFPSVKLKKGLTFVEVLVSSIILMLVLAEMLAGFAGGRLLSRRARDRLMSLSLAREKMEELFSLGYAGLAPYIGENSDAISDQDFVRRTNAQRIYKVENIPNLFNPLRVYYRKITVVVKWQFLRPDVTHTESLSSLVYNPNYTP
jgi:hypothetical protein